MNTKKKKTNFIVQGSILAAASFISRIIGMLYRIPLTGIIGDDGNGIYSVAFEVYAILLMISSYSLPLAVSKLVAAKQARKERKDAFRYFKYALLFAFGVGTIVGVFTYFCSDFIAGKIMSSPMSAFSLRVLAPAILVTSVMGVIRGYFQGVGSMIPTAVSQLIEQIVNAVVSVTMGYSLFQYGRRISNLIKVEGYDAAYGAAGGTLGTLVGGLAGLVFLLLILGMYYSVNKKRLRMKPEDSRDSVRKIYTLLIFTIVPVILSTAIYNVCTVLDQGVYNKIMSMQGVPMKKYIDMYGIFSGKFRLLCNVPIAMASAMAASTVITISSATALRDTKAVIDKTRLCLRFTMLITIPCFVGLTVLATPILRLLWGDGRAITANMFYIGTISVVFYSLSTVTNGILQGIDRMRIPVINAAVSVVAHLALLVVLLVVFRMNIYAVVIGHVFFGFIMCLLNNIALARHIKGYRQEVVRTFLIPFLAAGIMGAVIFGGYRLLIILLHSNAIATILMILVGMTVYFVLILLFGGISEQELRRVPKGALLIKIAQKLHLL